MVVLDELMVVVVVVVIVIVISAAGVIEALTVMWAAV